MDDKELDKLFRDRLYSHSTPVGDGDGLWEGIATAMDKGGRPSVFRKRAVYIISSAAAVLVAAYFIFAPSSQKPYMQVVEESALSSADIEEAVPQEIPIFQPKFQPGQPVKMKKLKLLPPPVTVLPVEEDSLLLPAYMAEVGDMNDANDTVAVQEAVSAQDLFPDWGEDIYVGKRHLSKYTLAVASNITSGNSMEVSGDMARKSYMSPSYEGGNGKVPVMEQVSDTKYSLPLNIGLQVQIRINQSLSVGTGVSYTMLRSKYDCLVDKKMHSARQTLHYVGIPVNVYGTILQKKGFSVYANLGGTIEKGVRASYFLKSYDQTSEYGTSIDGVQFSVNFGFGVEYRFVRQFGFYIEPNAVYFFNSEIPNSIRTDQPFQLKAEVGFRLHL